MIWRQKKNRKSFYNFLRFCNFQMVGMMRVELTTFWPPVKRANQAALHPDDAESFRQHTNIAPFYEKSSWFAAFSRETAVSHEVKVNGACLGLNWLAIRKALWEKLSPWHKNKQKTPSYPARLRIWQPKPTNKKQMDPFTGILDKNVPESSKRAFFSGK